MHRLLFGCALIVGCGGNSDDSTTTPVATGTPGTSTPGALVVTLETAAGPIDIELYEDEAPNTVANFLAYVDSGFFDGSDGDGAGTFYRAIPDFVLQGGGVRVDGTQKATDAAIANEAIDSGLLNTKRSVAMARTTDPDSATTEFFINLADNDFLDPGGATTEGYAVFGKVVGSMAAVDDIVGGPVNGEYLVDPVAFDSAARQR